MRHPQHDKLVHFEYIGNTPNGATVNVFYAGSVSAIDVANLAQMGLAITGYVVSTDTEGSVTLFHGADTNLDSGEQVMTGNFNAKGGVEKELNTPYYVPVGRNLRVSGAGDIRVSGTGFLYRG